jgi:hypothetical protein
MLHWGQSMILSLPAVSVFMIRFAKKIFRVYLGNSSWIRLILSHHQEHEDHKGETHKFTFIFSCPSCPGGFIDII